MKKILSINNLKVITLNNKIILENINMHLNKGEIVAIVGESGSGKTTILKSIFNILNENLKKTNGIIEFNKDIVGSNIETLRGKKVGYIFQESNNSLNPVVKVGKQIQENYIFYDKLSKKEAKMKTLNLLKTLNFEDPVDVYNKYPHQLSGGQNQRIMIASAISNFPDIIIADEPVSSLDINLKMQMLEFFQKLKKEHNMSFIIVTHDFKLLSAFIDRVYVLHKGKIVEEGFTQEVLINPKDDYTKKLIKSSLILSNKKVDDT